MYSPFTVPSYHLYYQNSNYFQSHFLNKALSIYQGFVCLWRFLNLSIHQSIYSVSIHPSILLIILSCDTDHQEGQDKPEDLPGAIRGSWAEFLTLKRFPKDIFAMKSFIKDNFPTWSFRLKREVINVSPLCSVRSSSDMFWDPALRLGYARGTISAKLYDWLRYCNFRIYPLKTLFLRAVASLAEVFEDEHTGQILVFNLSSLIRSMIWKPQSEFYSSISRFNLKH